MTYGVLRKWGERLTRLSAVSIAFLQPLAHAGGPVFFGPRASPVKAVAKAISRLELDLERNGTVVAKAPDVWGQARLTQHREEFERQMALQLNSFAFGTNAEIARTDQAFLAQALSLSALVNQSQSGSGGGPPTAIDVTSMVSGFNPAPPATPGTANGQATATANDITIVRANPFQNFTQAAQANGERIVIEPEILLDQRKRFLNHLHEIRRINEGDDTADSPGYSLNLVRIPISVIPGSLTREGYGAEITVTATPHLTPELLPSTFRTLVINDLVDQLSFPIVKYLEVAWPLLLEQEELERKQREDELSRAQSDSKSAAARNPLVRQVAEETIRGNPEEVTGSAPGTLSPGLPAKPASPIDLNKQPLEVRREAQVPYLPGLKRVHARLTDAARKTESLVSFGQRTRRSRFAIPPTQLTAVYGEDELVLIARSLFERRDLKRCNWTAFLPEVQGFLREELDAAYEFLTHRRVLQVTPGTSIPCEATLWDWADPTLGQQIRSGLQLHGKAPIQMASRVAFFRTLHGDPTAVPPVGGPALLPPEVVCPTCKDETPDLCNPCIAHNVTEALAWAVLVESVLLNDRLNEDLRRVAQDPNCGCHPAEFYPFYGPNPPPEARQAFMDYVRCRWPIHVFALDPETQQQNVADSLSIRREMQLAVALAFTARRTSAQSLTRYMRRLEMDMRTIALNNTAVGFSRGENTFGWRFYPRIQTPPFEGNLTVVTRDLLIGGPNQEAMLRRQRIEPGTRECVALVVMPSFVKHVQFETRSDWFKLTKECLHHFHEFRPTMTYTMNWSEDIRAVQDAAECCRAEQERYRSGDVERMLARVEQLSQSLPMQTLYSQVPYENTLGGFEMFSSGVTDLAPELIGFYGVPGIDTSRPTKLFLVGNHFSVHDTRVMAGNRKCEISMLSRQVMEVTVPPGVQTHKRRQMPPPLDGRASSGGACEQCPTPAVADSETGQRLVPLYPDQRVPKPGTNPLCPVLENPCCNAEHVEVVLATPYGVAAPLEVPVVRAACPDPQLVWSQPSTPYEITYYYTFTSGAANAVVIGNNDILVAGKSRLAISAPTGVLLGTAATNKVELLAIVGQSGLAKLTTLSNVRFDVARRELPMDGDTFIAFHTNLRDAIQTFYTNTKEKPSPEVFLSISATVIPDVAVTSFPVEGELPIRIKFVEKTAAK